MAIERVARHSVADQVFDQLLSGILSGENAPGTQLPPERELALQAGVNRQAVREALQRLRQMDLVEIVHGGGINVLDWRSTAGLALLPLLLMSSEVTIDPMVVRSIMELRSIIGADAARWCATRAAEGTSERLFALVDEMDRIESDPAQWGEVGFDFWVTIVDGADNIAYRLAFNTLREVAKALTPAPQGTLSPEWQQRHLYRAIAEAVAAGDAETAGSAADELLNHGVKAVNDWMAFLEIRSRERAERAGAAPAGDAADG